MTLGQSFDDLTREIAEANLPDTCKIMRTPTTNDDGWGNAGDPTEVVTGVKCRVHPMMGRFNRIEGIIHQQLASADYIVTMVRSDSWTLYEKDVIVVTASENPDYVGKELDVVLTMDGAGEHIILEAPCNEVK